MIKTKILKKSNGSIIDILSVGICILSMTVIMMACFNSMQLVNQKAEISQLARKYILRMETVGYLTANDKAELYQNLLDMGIRAIDFEGTTMNQVGYGNPVILCITGAIVGKENNTEKGILETVFPDKEYAFRELRMSTAKN